jgi:hypothetical protein
MTSGHEIIISLGLANWIARLRSRDYSSLVASEAFASANTCGQLGTHQTRISRLVRDTSDRC